MITSLSSLLEEKIRISWEESTWGSIFDLYLMMEKCVAADELWLVPAEPIDVLTESCDADVVSFEGPDNKRLRYFRNKENADMTSMLVAFSSREELEKCTLKLPPIPMIVPLKAETVLRTALAHKEMYGLSLNPGADHYVFDKKDLEVILYYAADMKPGD